MHKILNSVPVVLSWMAFRELIMWARESVVAIYKEAEGGDGS